MGGKVNQAKKGAFWCICQLISCILISEGIGVRLALKIMGKVGVYYQAEDIDSTLETVPLDLNPCVVVLAIL